MAFYQVSGEHILRWSGLVEADDADQAEACLKDALAESAELVDYKYEIECLERTSK